MKRIIVSYQDYIVMEPTLDQALERLFQLIDNRVPTKDVEEHEGEAPPSAEEGTVKTPQQLLEEIDRTFTQYEKANQAGNYAEAGQALQRLEQLLSEWRAAQTNSVDERDNEADEEESS